MISDRAYIFLAILFWVSGYFIPAGQSKIPMKLFRSYILLPKWLTGFIRIRKTQQLPDGVISTSAFANQITAFFILLLYLGFKLGVNYLDNPFFHVYGWILCGFIAIIISVIIGRLKPYSIE